MISREDAIAAIAWARLEVSPAMNVAQFARLLGLPRTTYNAYERGEANPPEEVLIRAGHRRGLPENWYKDGVFTELVESSRKVSGVGFPVPTVVLKCIGRSTSGSLASTELTDANSDVVVPANFGGPGHVAAIADVEDTSPEFEHGTILIFNIAKQGTMGKFVHIVSSGGKSSLRRLDWDATEKRLVYRSLVGRPSLARENCTEEGLLVGHITVYKPGKFFGRYDEDGL